MRFFDNCLYGNLNIEALGSQLGAYIAGLRFTDGTPVPQVDIVAHSMGGIIARAYLSGKQQTAGVFNPPPDPKIRKLVFIGTPNFGSFKADGTLCTWGVQLAEMAPGSQFLWDLARWNQGFDDLRAVDAIAIIGNGGNYYSPPAADDGIVSLTSASTFFVIGSANDRTRIIPYCHTDPSTRGVDCPLSTPLIAKVDSQSHPTARIVRSFLADTPEWRSIGSTASQDQFLSRNGGLHLAVKDANDNFYESNLLSNTTQASLDNGTIRLRRGPSLKGIFFNAFIPSGTHTIDFTLNGTSYQTSYTQSPGGTTSLLVKFPPIIGLALPAAGIANTLSLAPGSLISIYGSGLANTVAQAQSTPLPTQLADATVSANDQPIGLLYASNGQINALLPPGLSGLVRIKVRNSLGQHTTNVLMAPAVPAIFAADGSGRGPGAVLHATTGQLVTQNNPAVQGEYISIYATGLGSTFRSGGLDVASIAPRVMMDNNPAPVIFAGLAPGFLGLYQINVQVPVGTPPGLATPLTVISGKYTSNAVTIAIQ